MLSPFICLRELADFGLCWWTGSDSLCPGWGWTGHSLSYCGDNAGSALWTGGVTGGAGASTPRPLQAGLSVCPAPAGEEAPPPGSSSRPPLSSSPRLCSVPVASLGVRASCVTTKVQTLCSRRRDGSALSPLTEREIYSFINTGLALLVCGEWLLSKSVVVFSNPEVVGVNERAYGEGFVEEVITISRKRVLLVFSHFFRRSVASPCVRGCACELSCVCALVCVKKRRKRESLQLKKENSDAFSMLAVFLV